jgi:predicted dienelactone hydrolase
LRAFVWSPCATPPTDTNFGPIIVPAVRGCPVVGENLPLVVISHGHSGGALNHHDTAEALRMLGLSSWRSTIPETTSLTRAAPAISP